MIHVRNKLRAFKLPKPIYNMIFSFDKKSFELLPFDFPVDRTVFLNIEVTGLEAQLSKIIIATILYYSEGEWIIEQWFTETKEDEEEVIHQLYTSLLYFYKIITYNGENFLIPYCEEKFKIYKLDKSIKYKSADLYLLMRKIKKNYEFINLKLDTIENYLGLKRTITMKSNEMLTYYQLATDGNEQYRNLLLKYCAESVISLCAIFIYFINDFFPILNKIKR